MDKSDISAQRLMEIMYRIARRRQALFHGLLSRYGVTLHQFHLLLYMKDGGKTRVTDLSDMMMVSKPTASRMINTLCDKGLVRKKTDERDRRLVFLMLTAKGDRVLSEIQARQREMLSRLLGKMTVSEMRAFLETVEKIEVELAALPGKETTGGGKE
jgi:DNA-binding MarR family transcriptional regulator